MKKFRGCIKDTACRLSGFLVILLVGLLTFLLSGCKTASTENNVSDTLRHATLNYYGGIAIRGVSKVTDLRDRYSRILVLSEKGDTIRDTEKIYIRERYNSESNDSVAILRNTVDSLLNVKQRYIRYTVEKKPPWIDQIRITLFLPLMIILISSLCLNYLLLRRK